MRSPIFALLLLSPLLAEEPRITNLGISTFAYGRWHAVDVDGDGDLDFVSTPIDRVFTTAQITWFENLGDGSFSQNRHLGYTRNPIARSDHFPTDSNQDGLIDFFSFEFSFPGVEICFLDPLGSGQQVHIECSEKQDFYWPRVVDLEKDHHPFVIDFRDEEEGFLIFEVTADREIIPLSATAYSLPDDFSDSTPDVVKAIDFDRDGDRDLLISCEDEQRTLIFERLSRSEFSAEPFHDFSEYYEHCDDLDGDGDLDLYSERGWLENQDNFSNAIKRGSMPSFDGLARTPGGLRLIERDGSEVVEYQLQVDGSWLETFRQSMLSLPTFDLFLEIDSLGFQIADLTGDGRDEIIFIRNNGRAGGVEDRRTHHLTALKRTNSGYEEVASSPRPAPIEYRRSVAADFDSDGNMDVLVGPTPAGEHFLQLNDGLGNFTLAPAPYHFYPDDLDPADYRIISLRPVYFNGDEHLDLAVTFEERTAFFRAKSACTIIKGTGPLTFEPTILPEGALTYVQRGFCGISNLVDWDGDEDLDAIIEGAWLENIDGELSTLARPLVPNAFTTDALGNPIQLAGHQIADIDGDGAPDYLAFVHEIETRYFISTVIGEKIYLTLEELLAAGISPTTAQSEPFSRIAIGFNRGDGTIEEVVSADISLFLRDAVANPVVRPVGVLDLNKDGTLQLVSQINGTDALGNPVVTGHEIWSTPEGEPRNFGEMTKEAISLSFLPDTDGLMDFDGDGTLEYVSANQFVRPSPQGPLLSPLYNFTGDVAVHHSASRPGAIALADFDGDGDLDHLLPDGVSRLSLVRNLIIDERSPITRELQAKGFIGAEANPDADCDGDGFSNAHEFLFGTDPTVNQIEDPANLAPTWVDFEGGRELTFLRRRDAGQLKLDYVLERSLDLKTWKELRFLELESTPIDETWERVTTKGLIGSEDFFYRTHPQHRP